ncbi:hypothetical protein ZWY2020_034781 [Hordeum vulgare]|nr:hypothetical protein ZWY2020_034781 [Hordeum vulgare]
MKKANNFFLALFKYFQVKYIEEKLQKYIQKEDGNLSLKNADDIVSYNAQLILGIDKISTITTNWSWFHHHATIPEGDICAFHFERQHHRRLSLTVHPL